MSEQSLERVLDGEAEEPVIAEPEAEPTVEPVEPEAKADEPAKDAPTASKDKPEATIEQQLAAQITKAQDEKGKRQKLKQENEVLRQQMAAKKPEAPDAFAEPDKALEYAKAELRQEFQGQFLNMSEMNAKARHTDDFDEMTDLFFSAMVAENPALQAEALKQADPYEFIYRSAKNHTEMAQLQEAGGVEGYRTNLEKELRAKWDVEQAEKAKAGFEKKLEESIPGSLSTQRAAGSNKGETSIVNQPLEEILEE